MNNQKLCKFVNELVSRGVTARWEANAWISGQNVPTNLPSRKDAIKLIEMLEEANCCYTAAAVMTAECPSYIDLGEWILKEFCDCGSYNQVDAIFVSVIVRNFQKRVRRLLIQDL